MRRPLDDIDMRHSVASCDINDKRFHPTIERKQRLLPEVTPRVSSVLPVRPKPMNFDYVNCAGTWLVVGMIVATILWWLSSYLAGTMPCIPGVNA